MKLHKLFTEDRAVSPVVGVALLIAIAVILAAVIGAVVLGIGTGGAEVPQAQLTADIDAGENNATLMHDSGEPLPADEVYVQGSDDESVYLHDDDDVDDTDTVTAGESVELDVDIEEDDEITVIWEDPDSDTEHQLDEFRP